MTELYEYDDLDQLTTVKDADNNVKQSWNLDSVGNWSSYTDGATTTTTKTFDAANQTDGFGYDRAGNLTSDGTHAYVYDAWNRLVSVSDGATTVEYQYDGQGRRTERIVGATVEHDYYDGQQVIQVYTSSDGVFQSGQQYVWSLGYIDTPVLRDSYDAAGDLVAADRLYYLSDANHNVTAVVNSAGAVVERYSYNAYGEVTYYNADWTEKAVQTSSVGNTRLFAGMDYDPSTGMYYDRARWYNPATGKFLTRDPIGFASGDVNLYRYVGNAPMNATDPIGLTEYEGNRPLQIIPGVDHTKPEPNYPNNHTFRYVIDANGELHVYSWDVEKDPKAAPNKWSENAEPDKTTAKRDIEAGHVANKHKPISDSPADDAALAIAFKLLQRDPNSGSNHPNGLVAGNCKDEAKKLDSLAKIVKDASGGKKGEEAAKKQLRDNVWIPGVGWVERGSKAAKEWAEKVKQEAKKALEKVKDALKKTGEALKKAVNEDHDQGKSGTKGGSDGPCRK